MSDEEIKALTDIAYCASGMIEAENENNLGDAKNWKRQLELSVEKYDELKYGN